MARLDVEKEAAALAARENGVHCPEWLGARVLPNGSRGGYRILIETEGFTVKVLGVGVRNRPGLYVEMRSLFLHTHPEGAAGACEAAIAWVRGHLLCDQDADTITRLVSFKAAKLSRADIHIDWQGGDHPQLEHASDELRRFIRPGKTKWDFHGQGQTPTGYEFGKHKVMARIYNKTIETSERANEAYAALLTARCGEAYDPERDVWRLEFELNRDGAKGFKLYAQPDMKTIAEDDEVQAARMAAEEAELDAELAAEELEHIGTLPRFVARMGEIMTYLMTYWLRFVEDDGTANRSRWPMRPTWATLRDAYPKLAQEQALPLEEDKRAVVRGARYTGKARILRRLQLGIVSSLEVEDASPTSAALAALQRWVEVIAEREMDKIAAKCARYESQGKPIPRWVWRGMEERYNRVEQIEHRVRMLRGVFGACGVLPLEFKPAHTVGDLLVQHLDALEDEADAKGGIQQVLEDHFAKVYKLRPSLAA